MLWSIFSRIKNVNEVFIAVNNLNELIEEFDYQLWAIADQGPIGIGLVNEGMEMTLQQMRAVAQAERNLCHHHRTKRRFGITHIG
jgi:anti-sigma-K factor RskA